mmetsp:Transcript_837/g.1478  ORF Transcript_837/g.1478 Transcript_837/m.1478 type:complete len:206 (-) Transcript_837:16-633(-)
MPSSQTYSTCKTRPPSHHTTSSGSLLSIHGDKNLGPGEDLLGVLDLLQFSLEGVLLLGMRDGLDGEGHGEELPLGLLLGLGEDCQRVEPLLLGHADHALGAVLVGLVHLADPLLLLPPLLALLEVAGNLPVRLVLGRGVVLIEPDLGLRPGDLRLVALQVIPLHPGLKVRPLVVQRRLPAVLPQLLDTRAGLGENLRRARSGRGV